MYEKPLSYSGMSLYKKCPKAWADNYINGNKQPSGRAAQRGNRIHDQLEQFMLGSTAFPTTKTLEWWADYMNALAEYEVFPEEMVAVDSDWLPIGYDDPSANLRGKIDLRYSDKETLHIKDWKTGRIYPKHEQQGETYLALSEDVAKHHDRIVVEMVYIDQQEIRTWEYTPADIAPIKEGLIEIIDIIRSDEKHEATPSMDACQWCNLGWRKGGPCTDAP